MTEALNEVEAEASVIFRQRRHALLVLRPLASSQLADPALESDAGCEAGGALGAARLAFGDGALSHDRVFAALLGGGPLSEVAPFVYLIAEGNGLRVIARGPLRVVELPNAPQVGIRPSVINSGDALTWVEAVLPTARGVEVTVHDDRRGLDEVPIQLFFAERDEEISETLAPANEAPETAADPDLDGAVGPGEAVQEGTCSRSRPRLRIEPRPRSRFRPTTQQPTRATNSQRRRSSSFRPTTSWLSRTGRLSETHWNPVETRVRRRAEPRRAHLPCPDSRRRGAGRPGRGARRSHDSQRRSEPHPTGGVSTTRCPPGVAE